ncbi:MAG: hypothetical protein U9N45_06245, partial [Gemmatimonadota bacterium]|nr:hypothetical protein [Gemmatimonadota bacterium]
MSAEGSIEESLRKIDEEGIAKGWDGAIITLEKDGQIKVKYQKRVVWDGSPIESEVLYHFN